MSANYKIVPAVDLPPAQKIADLSKYLAASLHLALEDKEFEKAAMFQQHVDIFNLLIEQSRDRIG